MNTEKEKVEPLPLIEKIRPLLEIEQNAKNIFCSTVNISIIYQQEKAPIEDIKPEMEAIKKLMLQLNEQYATINKKIYETTQKKETETETAN